MGAARGQAAQEGACPEPGTRRTCPSVFESSWRPSPPRCPRALPKAEPGPCVPTAPGAARTQGQLDPPCLCEHESLSQMQWRNPWFPCAPLAAEPAAPIPRQRCYCFTPVLLPLKPGSVTCSSRAAQESLQPSRHSSVFARAGSDPLGMRSVRSTCIRARLWGCVTHTSHRRCPRAQAWILALCFGGRSKLSPAPGAAVRALSLLWKQWDVREFPDEQGCLVQWTWCSLGPR